MNDTASQALSEALDQVDRGLAFAQAHPGTELDLPAPPVSGHLPSPDLLTVVGALYAFAEIETSGAVVCVEELIRLRRQVQVAGRLPQLLEELSVAARRWPTFDDRRLLYARIFGMFGAPNESASGAGFLSRLAELCGTLSGAAGQPSVPMVAQERVRYAFERFLLGISSTPTADLRMRATELAPLVRSVFEVLGNADLAAFAGVRGAAAVLRALVGPNTEAVDLPSALERARAGQAVIGGCGRLLGNLRVAQLVTPTDPIVRDAARWLASYHLGVGGLA